MGIPVIEGRDFSKADELSDHTSYIFNRTAMEGLDMQVGDAFDSYSPGHLIGFSDDVKFTSLRGGEDNIAFLVGNFGYSLPILLYPLESRIGHSCRSRSHSGDDERIRSFLSV